MFGVLRRLVAEDFPDGLANLELGRHAERIAELQPLFPELMHLDKPLTEFLDGLLDFVRRREDLVSNWRG